MIVPAKPSRPGSVLALFDVHHHRLVGLQPGGDADPVRKAAVAAHRGDGLAGFDDQEGPLVAMGHGRTTQARLERLPTASMGAVGRAKNPAASRPVAILARFAARQSGTMAAPTFQELIQRLNAFWADQGCVLIQPLDLEVGAGTFHPATFLRALGPEPWNAAYVQPCRRPTDGRYGENPNRLQRYYQYQVAMKPSPDNIVELYFDSLKALGVDPLVHDLRLVEDNWESPTLGAWGLGWEVWLNGMEVTQFTYFQQAGGMECRPVLGEITYGLERLCMYLQNVDNVYDLVWTHGPRRHAGHLRRRLPPERSRAERLQLRARRRRRTVPSLRRLRGRGAEADRAGPAAAGLRPGLQGQPQLQPARCAPRDQRDRAPALHPARAPHRPGRGRGVLRAAREAGLSGAEEDDPACVIFSLSLAGEGPKGGEGGLARLPLSPALSHKGRGRQTRQVTT